MLSTLVFFVLTGAIMAVWSRLFRRVPLRVAIFLWAAVAVWQHDTLFSRKVDVPGGLTSTVYPWKAPGRPIVHANTGIAVQEMLPWTESARRALRAGELPLWERGRGAGGLLLGDLQNAIFHPFTLAGLFLPIGKAWTLSVALRLFCALFFTFMFLRSWDLREEAALFGAVAYGFCTFHIVWLVISIGLSVTMLPMALAAADELLRRPRIRSHAAVVMTLAMTILSGHPETVFFVALVVAAYAVYLTVVLRNGVGRLLIAASAALAAMIVTSCVWYPTATVITQTDRYRIMSAVRVNPPQHRLGAGWLMPLVSPDILGTVPGETYLPPGPAAPDLLIDYGEVCSAYAGLITLVLAVAGILIIRRSALARFGAGTAVVAFLTFAEVPGWFSILRSLPPFDVSLLQRWRFAWCLGIVLLAAAALDAFVRGAISRRSIIGSGLVVLSLFAVVSVLGLPSLFERSPSAVELVQVFTPAALLLIAVAVPPEHFARAATAAVFIDLMLVTLSYNPPADPADVFPITPAIRTMLDDPEPHRMVATGWSFIPDTPGFYGLEDVKTTDPLARAEYLRLFKGYFATRDDFDQVVQATHYPFTDLVNVRYVYAPPNGDPLRTDLREIYRGPDGTVYRNERAMPRYFLAQRIEIEPVFDNVVAKMKLVTNFRDLTFVDHVPPQVSAQAPALVAATAGPLGLAGGEVRIAAYCGSSAELDVVSHGWNMLASSDTWWPGWRAYWNGQRLPPVVVNGAFVGFFIPPGRARLRLRFRPVEFDVGLRFGSAALFILVCGYVATAVRNRRVEGP